MPSFVRTGIDQLSRDEIKEMIPYAVIVENWDKRLQGRGKRNYTKEFTTKQKSKLGAYQRIFRKWHLESGIPDSFTIKSDNLSLIQRAAFFFANI